MAEITTNTADFINNDSVADSMNILSPRHATPKPAINIDNGGVSNDNGDVLSSGNIDTYVEKTSLEIESISKQKEQDNDDSIIELEDKHHETGPIQEKDFHANKNDIPSIEQTNAVDVITNKTRAKESTDTSSIASFKTLDHYKDNVIDATNKEESETDNTIDETSNQKLEQKADDISNKVLPEASNKTTYEVIDETRKKQCDVESVSGCILEPDDKEEDIKLVTENEPEGTVLQENEVNVEEGTEVIDNETSVIPYTHSPSSDVDAGSVLDVLSMGSGKSKESATVLNTELAEKQDSSDVVCDEKDLDIEEIILPNDAADPGLDKTDAKKDEPSEKGKSLGGNRNNSKKPRRSKKLSQGNSVIKVKSLDRKISTVRDAQSKSTGKKVSTPRVTKKDDQKLILPRETKASLARKIGIDHTKDKPTFVHPTRLPKSSVTDKTVERPSQIQFTRDAKLQQSSASDKTSEIPTQIQSSEDTNLQTSLVTDKTSENPSQFEATKNTLQTSDVTDKTSLLENQEADESKIQQTNDKDDTENKTESSETKGNSSVENTQSSKENDTEVKKEVETKPTKDQNIISKSTFTKVNETENKKSPKVKWSEKVKVTLQSKNTGKPLPNGNLSPKDKNKHVKTEPVKHNEQVGTTEEKGKSMEPIVEGEETSNEKFNPKSILAKAAWNKGIKDKSGQGSVTQNGPAFLSTKTLSKSSLAVHSGSTGDDKDDKLSVGSRRDSTMLSLDSVSHKSIDYRNTSTVVNPVIEEKPGSLLNNNDSWIRSAIPYQPLSLSILCLFLNTILPGSGTILSGLSILCCGKTRVTTKDDHVPVTVCVNVWVGVAQLFTITFCLVGWFWSIAWGIKMVILSVEYRRELKAKREKELQAMALSAFGSPSRGRALFPGMA